MLQLLITSQVCQLHHWSNAPCRCSAASAIIDICHACIAFVYMLNQELTLYVHDEQEDSKSMLHFISRRQRITKPDAAGKVQTAAFARTTKGAKLILDNIHTNSGVHC